MRFLKKLNVFLLATALFSMFIPSVVIFADTPTKIQNKISLSQTLDNYGVQIAIISILLVVLLIAFVIILIHANYFSKMQRNRFLMLAELSDEYVFEYEIKSKKITLSSKSIELMEQVINVVSVDEGKENIEVLFDPCVSTQENVKKLIRNNINNREFKFKFEDGSTRFLKAVNSENIGGYKQRYVIGKFMDISEEKKKIKELIKKAQIDIMSGLLNSETCKNEIEKRIKQKPEDVEAVLILLDVDRFKEINDTYGHIVGDNVIIDLSKILKTVFRKNDIIGRVGGDEFCIYLEDISKKMVNDKINDIQRIVKSDAYRLSNYSITLSIGVTFVNNITNFALLYNCADNALYDAKNGGKDCFKFY